jgi:hypothetical protein
MNYERWFAKKFGIDLRYNEINGTHVHSKSIPSELDDPYRRLGGASEGVTYLNSDWMVTMRELYNDRQQLRRRMKKP